MAARRQIRAQESRSALPRDDFSASMNWYQAVLESYSLEADESAIKAGWHGSITQYAMQDPLALAATVRSLEAQGMLADDTVLEMETAHRYRSALTATQNIHRRRYMEPKGTSNAV
ncbi:hypothetical protein LTR78_010848 [Recurvomyces mirabilis]|uniref:Uncharacterized protein n=1 Tax=Recurvomyces mirabilis TaxID=574656 RepID=A0AAE0TMK7_9PEZI|nr:hypothetical protein LTR78_010848 [Recurvomyces mirabilis]KAK5150341.1 hypothetical protein LTS14_010180 [Recurvomyces mirabilis]